MEINHLNSHYEWMQPSDQENCRPEGLTGGGASPIALWHPATPCPDVAASYSLYCKRNWPGVLSHQPVAVVYSSSFRGNYPVSYATNHTLARAGRLLCGALALGGVSFVTARGSLLISWIIRPDHTCVHSCPEGPAYIGRNSGSGVR